MKLLIGVTELAEALNLKESTVRYYVAKEPDKLPPQFDSGTKRLLWSVADVERWVEMRSYYKKARQSSEIVREQSGCSTPEAT